MPSEPDTGSELCALHSPIDVSTSWKTKYATRIRHWIARHANGPTPSWNRLSCGGTSVHCVQATARLTLRRMWAAGFCDVVGNKRSEVAHW